MNGKILFIGHAASRSGAPILLLQFMRWLKANSAVTFDIDVVQPGPLLSELQSLAPTEVLRREPSLARRAMRKLVGAARWSGLEDRTFARRVKRGQYDLAYVNTIVPTRQIHSLSALGLPVICHVHELDFAMMHMVGEKGIAGVLSRISHFIAASNAVRDYLVDRWRINEARITVIHEFTLAEPAGAAVPRTRAEVRSTLGLSDDEILVGGCGTLDWRKGADLFIQITRLVRENPHGANVRFIWVGVDKSTVDYAKFVHDVRACGLVDVITLIESSPNPTEYYSAMDIFALTSREDPFPLVMLEAAVMGLPMVCFESSGGGPEFAHGDAGVVVPYLNVAAFAEQVVSLAGDAERRQSLGWNARAKVRDNYTIDRQAPKLLGVISRYLPTGIQT